MKKNRKQYWILLVCIPSVIFAQKKYVFGKITDSLAISIAFAKIENTNSQQVTRSDEKGDFFIWGKLGDTIQINKTGFYDQLFIINKIKEPKIVLKKLPLTFQNTEIQNLEFQAHFKADPSSKLLDEVIVRSRKLEDIRQEYLNLQGKRESLFLSPSGNSSENGLVGMVLSVDFLYSLFSKKGKNDRKLLLMKQDYLYEEFKKIRLTPSWISQLTDLQNSYQMDNFINFCNFPQNLVLDGKDYELAQAISDCFEEYKNFKK